MAYYITDSLLQEPLPWIHTDKRYPTFRTDQTLFGIYKPVRFLGKGTYGIVLEALTPMGSVAMKVSALLDNVGKRHHDHYIKMNHKGAKIMHLFSNSPYIIKIHTHFCMRCINYRALRVHIIIMELLKCNLYGITNSSLHFVKNFAYEALLALRTLHKKKITHTDIKLENFLMTHDEAHFKLNDFDTAIKDIKSIIEWSPNEWTTLWYRAPEIWLGIEFLTEKIDIFSLGCSIAELLKGYPLFHQTEWKDIAKTMILILGTPPDRFFDAPSLFPHNQKLLDEAFKIQEHQVDYFEQKLLQHIVLPQEQAEVPLFLHFLRSLLAWDPNSRPTAEKALHHPWIANSFAIKPIDDEETTPLIDKKTNPNDCCNLC